MQLPSPFTSSLAICTITRKLLAKGERVSTHSKIIPLVLMYSFFIAKINLANTIRQSQNKATAMNLQQQQQKQKSTKPLPPNFQYGASNVCILCWENC
jgi:hypothetical protein